LNNPNLIYYKAANRVLIYLYNIRQLFLRFGGQNNLIIASDAFFANNNINRKSLQAFAIKFFSGLIGWRANKQNTVITSIIEAELLALAQAVKESMYVSRLLQELIIDFND
jgi:hypothetical protein